MGLKPLLSFSSGELDPILHDNVTLEKFKKGLATARNVMIGKTGTIMSRFSRAHFVKAKNSGEKIKIFSPENSGVVTEWGNLYVRLYDFDGNLLDEQVHTYTEADLENMHFLTSGPLIYIFVEGKEPIAFAYKSGGDYFIGYPLSVISTFMFQPVGAPSVISLTAVGPPTGWSVDYAVTSVRNGQESLHAEFTGASFKKPIVNGESNTLLIYLHSTYVSSKDQFTSIRVYRRPTEGGAYGFIGGSTDLFESGGELHAKFIDLGGLADFTNGIPETITKLGLDDKDIRDLHSSTAVVYQQRILLTAEDDEEAILASRPGYKNSFYRDLPYDADSALKFKSGTSGNAKVLRMIENDGLIVFTSVGVFINLGVLGIDNLALEKKGSWVIDEKVPPLSVPGGVFFIDKSTNTIRQFIFNQDIGSYQSIDHSVFSDHLFKKRTIVSWAFQGGVAPLIIAAFSDGTFSTFTYNHEHRMRAWTRHESDYPVEQVEGTSIVDSTFFVTNKDGDRYIEVSLPRLTPSDVYISNPEADKLALNSFMDAASTKSNLLNDSLVGVDTFELTPVTPGDWEASLTLTCGTSALFPVGGLGDTGTIFRFFDITDKTVVDLEVLSRTSDNEVVVKPSAEFPEAQASDFRMYETFNQVTGLDHLEGEVVSVLVDGAVVASPNNDVENYTTLTVNAGVIDLPDSLRGAIIIVGRSITADVKTLNISTVEQSPTQIESLTVDKLYIRIHESRGLYVSNRFPEEKVNEVDGTSVEGMQDLHTLDVPSGSDIIGNRSPQPVSKRIEATIPGNWNTSGQISIRQVDPVHFEILSIIPDVEVLKRSDR